MAKVVARPWLNPEEDSDGMTCAESAEGSELNSVFLIFKWKSFHNCREKTQRQLEQSDQDPDIK